MMLTNTLTKKNLEQIIHESFVKFGGPFCCLLLDSLKFLGFYYATAAGISISAEDLKIPAGKRSLVHKADANIGFVSRQWKQGLISSDERFQAIIGEWNATTELIKKKISSYYKDFDPFNNLYVMSFSGARGNISQVRQLIGLRGLMSDQEGNIIDLPIKNCFKEGLTSIDYLISSYGARKGVVDTALKTADSGYLTRRLIYVAQDFIVRELDCGTSNSVLINLSKNKSKKNLLGKYLISGHSIEESADFFNEVLTEKSLELLLLAKKYSTIRIRSSLTCASSFSVCQKCYGWDLSKRDLISLGEAVGIAAAQSIGEPGTQLTMRTFHTGGIFTGEALKQTLSPFSGKIVSMEGLTLKESRTKSGLIVEKTLKEGLVKIVSWKGKEKILLIPAGSFFSKRKNKFIQKGGIISESSLESANLGTKKLRPLLSPLEGELFVKKIYVRGTESENLRRCVHEGSVLIHAGKALNAPKEYKTKLTTQLHIGQSIGSAKISFPFEGILRLNKNNIQLVKSREVFEIDFSKLGAFSSCSQDLEVYLRPICKNQQSIDAFTVVAFVHLLSKISCKIYSSKEILEKKHKVLFLVTNDDIFTVSSSKARDLKNSLRTKDFVEAGTVISKNTKIEESGILIKKDGSFLIFQRVAPIFVTKGAFLKSRFSRFAFKEETLAYIISHKLQNEDIVQGLPKINKLVEARPSKEKVRHATFALILLKPKRNGKLFEEKQDRQEQMNVTIFKAKSAPLTGPDDQGLKLLDSKWAPALNMSFKNFGEPFTNVPIDPRNLLKSMFLRHSKKFGIVKGCIICLNQFQFILSNSIQAIYESQGVNIDAKHFELIVREMTAWSRVIFSNCFSPYLEGETMRTSFMIEIKKAFASTEREKAFFAFEPVLTSITTSSINRDGFLTAAGFQRTKQVLIRAAFEGKKDWIKGLKDCIIVGRLMPAGSAFLNYKNYLDTIYLYRKLK